jgi:hypothetical protein
MVGIKDSSPLPAVDAGDDVWLLNQLRRRAAQGSLGYFLGIKSRKGKQCNDMPGLFALLSPPVDLLDMSMNQSGVIFTTNTSSTIA